VSANNANEPGLYGKVPAIGDFVLRRLPTRFVEPWDQWLRESLNASQTQLGGSWLDHYLTSPLWRFALSPGIAGQTGWAGVLMPSVDRVGRYFPLTLAGPLPAGASPFDTLCRADWFAQAEAVALASLEEGLDLDAFDAQVLALGVPGAPAMPPPEDPSALPRREGWHLDVPSPDRIRESAPPLLTRALEDLFFAYSLWSSAGSELVGPSLLACQGLPDPEGFSALLAGDWSGRGWLQLGRAP
jgi:type VI secretion system protein ImpM